MSNNLKLQYGQVVTVDGVDYEVVHVSTNDNPDYAISRMYELVLKTEADALRASNVRAAEIQAERDIARAELVQEAESLGVTDTSLERFPTNEHLSTYVDRLKEARAAEEAPQV